MINGSISPSRSRHYLDDPLCGSFAMNSRILTTNPGIFRQRRSRYRLPPAPNVINSTIKANTSTPYDQAENAAMLCHNESVMTISLP
jgi:hypothetical protein